MTTILFIHGFPFDHTMWRHQVTALSRWRCIAPDLRGVGEAASSQPPSEYTVAAYAGDLIRVLDDLKIADAVICGLSLGGYIAFEMLRSYHTRVRGAVLCNTKAPGDTPSAKRDRDAMAELAQRRGAAAIAEQLLPKVLSPTTFEKRPEVVSEVRAMITRSPLSGILGALHALRERPDSTPLLPTIRAPVLAIAGGDDQIAPADGMRAMAAAIRGAECVVIPEAGHLTPLEQPLAFTVALKRFLEKLS
ncbi:MAG TPA: alpha/beta fold hydrolase [Gemmatimonadales bacterium]|nr:alpha/beta fold hydrolase [Gemmatimonadales bacterium]